MRIKIINPDYGMTRDELAAREAMLSAVCAPDTELSMDCLRDTRVEIDSRRDVALAAPEILRMAMQAEGDGYDAVALYCLSDPGLDACREQLRIPVVGAGQASVLLAAMMGYRLSLLVTAPARIPEKRQFIRACGLDEGRIASVRGVEADHAALASGSASVGECLLAAARECVERDGADTLLLGCLSLAGLGKPLQEQLGVPVVDPAFACVRAAEGLVRLGLSHSPIAYPSPPFPAAPELVSPWEHSRV